MAEMADDNWQRTRGTLGRPCDRSSLIVSRSPRALPAIGTPVQLVAACKPGRRVSVVHTVSATSRARRSIDAGEREASALLLCAPRRKVRTYAADNHPGAPFSWIAATVDATATATVLSAAIATDCSFADVSNAGSSYRPSNARIVPCACGVCGRSRVSRRTRVGERGGGGRRGGLTRGQKRHRARASLICGPRKGNREPEGAHIDAAEPIQIPPRSERLVARCYMVGA
ncbi:hypothetical protein C8Q80DRAFT_499590 [Daedaleopsis nitida]|nr:hypothetical protein C8Q80DRAFT_499590 [Daedaleopsis nitida]